MEQLHLTQLQIPRLDKIFESYVKKEDPFEYTVRRVPYPLTRSRRWAWRRPTPPRPGR
jgi:hypothetical protein